MSDQDIEQYAFTRLLDEAEAAQQAELDDHRAKVQQWFDMLRPDQKRQLAEWMEAEEWLTCQALSAAAGDWHRSQPDQVAIREMVAGLKAAKRPRKPRETEPCAK
jgi:hypothetical protein